MRGPPRGITAEEADLRSVQGLCGGIRRPRRSPSPLHAAIFVVYLMWESCPHRRAKLSAVFQKKNRKRTTCALSRDLQVKRMVAARLRPQRLWIQWKHDSKRRWLRGYSNREATEPSQAAHHLPKHQDWDHFSLSWS